MILGIVINYILVADNKDAIRLALNLSASGSSSVFPSYPSPPSPDSQQVADALAVPSPITPLRGFSSRPLLSIRTPDASPQPQRFRSLAENSSPSRTPDFTLAGGTRSPTTHERLADIFRRRKSPLLEQTAGPSGSSNHLTNTAPRSSVPPHAEGEGANDALPTPNGKQVPRLVFAKKASTASPRGPAVSRKVAVQSVSTPLTNVLRHRRDKSNEAQVNGTSAAMERGGSQTASSVTESETQSTSASRSQPANGSSQPAHVPPNLTSGLTVITLTEEESLPKPKPLYNAGPIMRTGIRPEGIRAHDTPPSLDMRPSMRVRQFKNGFITLETVEPKKPKKPSPPAGAEISTPPDISVKDERPLLLPDPEDSWSGVSLPSNFDLYGGAGVESQWPLQTQAPYDFDLPPVQTQWKAFADSQSQ